MKTKFDIFFESNQVINIPYSKIIVNNWVDHIDAKQPPFLERSYVILNTTIKKAYISILKEFLNELDIPNNQQQEFILNYKDFGDLYSTNSPYLYRFTTSEESFCLLKTPSKSFYKRKSYIRRNLQPRKIVYTKEEVFNYNTAFKNGDYEHGVDIISDLF